MKKVKVDDMIKGNSWKPYTGGKFKFDDNQTHFTFVCRRELGTEVDSDEFSPLPIGLVPIFNFDDDNIRSRTPDDDLVFYRGFTEEEAEEYE